MRQNRTDTYKTAEENQFFMFFFSFFFRFIQIHEINQFSFIEFSYSFFSTQSTRYTLTRNLRIQLKMKEELIGWNCKNDKENHLYTIFIYFASSFFFKWETLTLKQKKNHK